MKIDPLDLSTLPRRIGDLPRRWSQQSPDNIALCQADTHWTWAQLAVLINEARELLINNGVRAGDRVMIVCENDYLVPIMLFAITDLDAWAVIVNARLSAREVDTIVEHSQPRRIIYTSRVSSDALIHAQRHEALAQCSANLDGFYMGPLNQHCETEIVYHHPDQQIAVMVYTSGTTGSPKGVMLSHQNISYIARAAGGMRDTSSADSLYLVLPMSHIFGLSSSFLGLMTVGGCVELSARFDPSRIVDAFARGISMFHGTPLMYAKILEHCEIHNKPLKLPAIRYISAGGSPLDISLKKKVDEAFNIPLNNGYGITECSPTVAQTVNTDPRNDDTVGVLLPGVEARIVDKDDNLVDDGDVGTLYVRGVSVMKGYYREPEKTAAVLDHEGWYNTGDLARFGEDKCLYIVGRCKELIIRSGFNVYPIEIESVLCNHPAVSASAVVGLSVPGNEEIIAYVQLEPGQSASTDEISTFIRDQLAPYKRPAHLIILDSLPYSATGKVLKTTLTEMAKKLN